LITLSLKGTVTVHVLCHLLYRRSTKIIRVFKILVPQFTYSLYYLQGAKPYFRPK